MGFMILWQMVKTVRMTGLWPLGALYVDGTDTCVKRVA
jgi:hypothetical protein